MKRPFLDRFRNNANCKYLLFISETDQFPVEINDRVNFFRTLRHGNTATTRNVESLDIFYYINYFKTISSVRNCVKKGFPPFFYSDGTLPKKRSINPFSFYRQAGFRVWKSERYSRIYFILQFSDFFRRKNSSTHTPRADYIGNVSFSEIRLAQSFTERQLFAVSVAQN